MSLVPANRGRSDLALEHRRRLDLRTLSPVVFLPVGALKQHGPHLPMNCDEVIPRRIAEEVAVKVGGLVAPSLSYGYKSQPRMGGGNHFPGTTSFSAQSVITGVRDIIEELARHGIRRIVAMDGHSENTMFITEGIDLALRAVDREVRNEIKVLRIGYYEFTSPADREDRVAGWFSKLESGTRRYDGNISLLHLHPELVDLSKLPTDVPANFPPYGVFPLTFENLPTLPRSGALNSSHNATAELGALMFNEYVMEIARAVRKEFGLVH